MLISNLFNRYNCANRDMTQQCWQECPTGIWDIRKQSYIYIHTLLSLQWWAYIALVFLLQKLYMHIRGWWINDGDDDLDDHDDHDDHHHPNHYFQSRCLDQQLLISCHAVAGKVWSCWPWGHQDHRAAFWIHLSKQYNFTWVNFYFVLVNIFVQCK